MTFTGKERKRILARAETVRMKGEQLNVALAASEAARVARVEADQAHIAARERVDQLRGEITSAERDLCLAAWPLS